MARTLPTALRKYLAASITGLSNGASVSSWPEASGGTPLTQATAASQPTYKLSAVNSKPGVDFQSTAKFMQATTSAQSQPVAIFAIVDSIPGGDAQLVHHGTELLKNTTDGWVGYSGDGGVTTPAASGPQTVLYVANGNSSETYVNGSLRWSGAAGATGLNTVLRVGLHVDGNRRWIGAILEVHEYAGVPTAAQRSALHSDAQDRYPAITVADYTADTADTTAPTITTFTATAGNAQVSLAWAGTDNVGITRWVLTRGGTTVYDGTATSFTDTGRTNGTALSYVLTAYDAAGNTKTASASATPVAPVTLGKLIHRWNGTALVLQRMDRWSGSALVQRIIEGAAAVASTSWPQAFGTLTAKPSWTNAAAAAGPLDQPAPSTRLRTITLPNAPAAGGDMYAAWLAYFGNRSGTAGTKAAGDQVIIPGGYYTFSDNLEIPPSANDIEVVFGTPGNPTTLRSTQMSSGLVTQHAIRVYGTNIRLRGVNQATPATIETTGVVGRNGLNQQGNTMLLLDPGSSDIYAQDLILRGARAAGFFSYGSLRYWLNRVTVEESLADGFHNTQGSSYGLFTDCVSRRAGDDGWAAVYYDGNAISGQSHHMEVYRLQVDTNGHGRGFANINCTDIVADQVIVRGSAAAGVIVDREAVSGGTDHGSIARTLYQRFLVEGCNWSEQDHGSVFLRNGITNGTVTGVVMESFEIRDSASNRTAVRTIGDGTANTVLECTLTDFRFSGGTSTTAGDQFGGNSTTRITRNGWANINPTVGVENVNPTVVINTPGRYATVTGLMTGSTTDTSAMRNTQAIQFYAGDAGTKVSGTNIYDVQNVQVKVGDTTLATVAGTALDTAKRGSQEWDTTQFTNGPARITLIATDKAGRTKTLTRDVVISNTTPGSLSGMPA